MMYKMFQFNDVIKYKSVGKLGLPKSEWKKTGKFPVIGQGQDYIEGWSDREDLLIKPEKDGLVVYGGHTRRAKHVSFPFVAGPNIKVLTTTSVLNSKFLSYFINQAPLENKGYADHFPLLRRIQIPVPPIKDQERTVEILEKTEILKEKKVLVDRKMYELSSSLFDKSFSNKNLPLKKMSDVCEFITDGTHQPPKFDSEGNIPFLFVRNIVGGSIDFNTEKFINEETYKTLTKKYKPLKGDILYSTVGSYGVPVSVDIDTEFSFQRHISHIRPKTNLILTEFLREQLMTDFVKKQADKKARGVAQKTLNLEDIRKMEIILPPIEAQKEFVEKIKTIRLLKEKQRTTSGLIENLFSSILSNTLKNHGI